MTQRTKFQIITTFDIVVRMDDDATQQDVIAENNYVISEATKVITELNGFYAGCGIIENVETILNK